MSQAQSGHIFISYSRKDDTAMRLIASFLQDQRFNVWVDNEKLVPGTAIWETEVEKAIKDAIAVVVVLSPSARESEWVRREIAYADQYRKRVFPVLVGGDADTVVPIRLATRQFVDLRSDERAGLEALTAAIRPHREEGPALRPTPGGLGIRKWMVPAGISLAILVVAVSWAGYRMLSAQATRPPETPHAPAVAATGTGAPPTVDLIALTQITPATDEALVYVNGALVLRTDTFDDPAGTGWNLFAGEIQGGALKIEGNENWDGVSRSATLGKGQGIIIDFIYSNDALFEIFVENGTFGSDSNRRYGVYVGSNNIVVNKYEGRDYVGGGALSGNLTLEPDTTYSLLIAVLSDGDFLEVIWNPSNQAENLLHRDSFNEATAGLTWTLWMQANSGTIHFDNFREISLDNIR